MSKIRKTHKVTFLLDKKNSWIESQLNNFKFGLNKKFKFKLTKNLKEIKNQDLVFAISYTKIISSKYLEKNKLFLIPHASKLPKNKGFSPIQYDILKNKKKFYISLIEATQNSMVDSGKVYMRSSFTLKGSELYDEIRQIQGKETLKIIKKFLQRYPHVSAEEQRGVGNFNKRRHPEDSEININKTIKNQFNHLRINSNELYPSFFYYKGNKYILKVYKDTKKK